MKKIFNVIGICALMCYLFIFPSCESSYDEDELLSDIEKKRNEIELKEMKSVGQFQRFSSMCIIILKTSTCVRLTRSQKRGKIYV
jgi:hypothetical protein